MIIKCDFALNENGYECHVSNHEIPAIEDRLIFKGQHKSGKLNTDVINVYFKDCILHKIPPSISDTFTNIEKLSIDHSKLKSITKDDLKQFENLKDFSSDNNDLEFLPGDLFEHTKKLEKMAFFENKIRYIGPSLLDAFPDLKYAEFGRNLTIDCFFTVNPDVMFSFFNKVTLEQLKQKIRTDCKPLLSESEMHKRYDLSSEREIVARKKITRRKSSPDQLMANNFLDDIRKFLAVDKFRDFTMKVGDRDFKVHKFLFAARSETFAELIANNPEAEDLVLQDISVEIFECILSYVYTDQLPAETHNMHEVFAAAGKLKIRGLMEISARMLIDSMEDEQDLEVLYKTLNFANKFEHNELRVNAFEEIKKHFSGSQLKDELAGQPEKLKKIIETKLMLEKQLNDLKI